MRVLPPLLLFIGVSKATLGSTLDQLIPPTKSDSNGLVDPTRDLFDILARRPVGRELQDVPTCDWKQIGEDIDGDESYDEFGWSVAMSGDGSTVAVGGPATSLFAPLESPGYVKIYEITGNRTILNQKGSTIVGEGGADTFGSSVALNFDGSIVAISAKGNDNENGRNAGRVQAFRYDGILRNDWILLGNAIDGEATNDFSGNVIALNHNGDILAIAARENKGEVAANNTETNINRGHVRVFKNVNYGQEWIQIGQDIDGDFRGDHLGYGMSMNANGSIVAVGAPLFDVDGVTRNSGRVSVYRFTNETQPLWTKIGNSIDGEEGGSWHGNDVSLNDDGTVVAVGALNSGSTRVFQFSDGQWTLLGNVIVGESNDDLFGFSVSLSSDGGTLAIGGRQNNGKNGGDSGHVRVFRLIADSWQQIGRDIDGESFSDGFGTSVALSRDASLLVVGGIWNDGQEASTQDDVGHARVFALESQCPPIIESIRTGIFLELIGGEELTSQVMSHYEEIVELWYEEYYALDDTIDKVNVRNVDTTIAVQNQDIQILNSNATVNVIEYNQNISYIDASGGAITDVDLILVPFRDRSVRRQLEDLLAAANISTSVEEPFFQSNTSPPTTTLIPESTSPSTLSIGGILGIAIAALTVGLLIAGVVYHRSRFHRDEALRDLPMAEPYDPEVTPAERYASSRTIAVEVLEDNTNGPGFKDQVRPDPIDAKSIGPDFKDQVRGEVVPTKAKTGRDSNGPEFKDQVNPSPNERGPSAQGFLRHGPGFKDQVSPPSREPQK